MTKEPSSILFIHKDFKMRLIKYVLNGQQKSLKFKHEIRNEVRALNYNIIFR